VYNRCLEARLGDLAPQLTGRFFGTVHNLNSKLTADFEILVEEHQGKIFGCMGVRYPLFGSGSLSGWVSGPDVQFDVTSQYMQIHFKGKGNGDRLTGTYHVISPPQDGQFELERKDSKGLPKGFDRQKDCPTDADMHR
jgi:hypothetical protein